MSKIKRYGIESRVVSKGGFCLSGMEVGDTCKIRNINGSLQMEGFDGCCPEMFNSALPTYLAMINGGELPDEDENGAVLTACPDPLVLVTFETRRIPMEEADDE